MTPLDALAAAELITVAARLAEAVPETLGYATRLGEAAARLAAHACTGAPYWRDKDAPGRRPKLYVIHGLNQACPLHGTPAPGDRIRTYVGCAPEKQRAAGAAMADEARRQALLAEQAALSAVLCQAQPTLRALLTALGYDPETGRPTAPERVTSVEDLLRR